MLIGYARVSKADVGLKVLTAKVPRSTRPRPTDGCRSASSRPSPSSRASSSASGPWPGSPPRGPGGGRGRKFALTKAQLRMAQAAMANRDTFVSELCRELKIKPVTLYRCVDPSGNLREHGKRLLGA